MNPTKKKIDPTESQKNSISSADLSDKRTDSRTNDSADSFEDQIMDRIAHYWAIAELSGDWLKNLGDLAVVELHRSAIALKLSLKYQMLLMTMFRALYLSICGGAALLTYHATQDLYFGIGIFIVLQVVAILLMQYRLAAFREKIGLRNTVQQLRECRHDLSEALKSQNS